MCREGERARLSCGLCRSRAFSHRRLQFRLRQVPKLRRVQMTLVCPLIFCRKEPCEITLCVQLCFAVESLATELSSLLSGDRHTDSKPAGTRICPLIIIARGIAVNHKATSEYSGAGFYGIYAVIMQLQYRCTPVKYAPAATGRRLLNYGAPNRRICYRRICLSIFNKARLIIKTILTK